jgi:hypothetical protein
LSYRNEVSDFSLGLQVLLEGKSGDSLLSTMAASQQYDGHLLRGLYQSSEEVFLRRTGSQHQ